MLTERQVLRRRPYSLAVQPHGYSTAAQAFEIGYAFQVQSTTSTTGTGRGSLVKDAALFNRVRRVFAVS